MKRTARYRPSGAMLVAIVAVVIASAGTATAASLITSRDIKNNTIRSKDIRNNTIRSRDVRNHTLLRRDFKPGVLVPGPRGATGPAGRNGINGFGTLEYPFDFDTLAANDSEGLEAVCPSGTFPTGGGALAFDQATPPNDVGDQVIQSTDLVFDESGTPVGYAADFHNTTAGDVDIQVDGACANAGRVVASRQHRHAFHR